MLSIAIVDQEEMQKLNAQYRGKDNPTNVLSFPQHEGEVFEAISTDLLGDVVICAQIAREQADELGYTLQEMVSYFLIHGILHLSGQHHDDFIQEWAMEQRLNELFGKLYPAE